MEYGGTGQIYLHLCVFSKTSWAEFSQSDLHCSFLLGLIGLTISLI